MNSSKLVYTKRPPSKNRSARKAWDAFVAAAEKSGKPFKSMQLVKGSWVAAGESIEAHVVRSMS